MSKLADKLSSRRLKGPEAEPIILSRKRIYILPTRYGVLFTLLLLIMLIGSINYNNSLGFALTFLMGSVAIISMLHIHRNLSGVEIKTGTTRSVFSGQNISFPFIISNTGKINKYAIVFLHNPEKTLIDIPANSTITTHLNIQSIRRGVIQLGRIKIFTDYPMSLFHAWSWVIPDCQCIIYPNPEDNSPPPDFEAKGSGELISSNKGQEDYYGMRHYQHGDPIKHIAWKQSARSNEIFTKEFSGSGGQTLWLEWDIDNVTSLEHKLSRLCRWVLECEKNDINYGLRIPGNNIPPGNGHKHQHICLSALALFAA